MKTSTRTLTGIAGAVLSIAIVLTTAAAANAAVQVSAASGRVAVTGQALPARTVAQSAPITVQSSLEVRAVNQGVGMPSGARWQSRPEAIFGRTALLLPPGTFLSAGQAAAALGVGSVKDSGWPQSNAGRVTHSGGGWSAGAGGWAMVQVNDTGIVNEILYVMWR